MDYLRVKNWEDFQHYKDRTPPWIKLYNQLLDDFEFSCLQDASKAHLLSIWLLASRTNNKIPNDPRWIGNKINATEAVNIKSLISSGFVEVIFNKNNELQTLEQDASKMLQTSEQDACLEREREGEKRESKVDGEIANATRTKKFVKPTIEEIYLYMKERDHDSHDEAESFYDYWESAGWSRKSGKIKDWRATVRTWLRNSNKLPTKSNGTPDWFKGGCL